MTTIDPIRERQRDTWNTFSAGWKKHDDFVIASSRPVGERLLDVVDLRDEALVLDAATGTGEPGLSAAQRVPSGRVVGTDIAADMLAVASDKAAARGIANYETKLCSAESSLPFPDGHFDAVVCRFGVMFFPDMLAGTRELARVLKPGRRVALAAWAEPAKNPWVTMAASVVNQVLSLPPPPADAPGIFRCAPPGTLTSLLQRAGLREIEEVEVTGQFVFNSPEAYWQFVIDVVAPVAMALSSATPGLREASRRGIIDAAGKHASSNKVSFGWSAWVASGVK